MKTKAYESAVLINAALEDEQIEGVISRIKDLLVNNGAEVKDIDRWGRKRLAYVVKKSKLGYYTIFRFDAPTNIVAKLERSNVLDEHILRHLTVELDNDAIEQLEKNKLSTTLVTEVEPLIKVDEPIFDEAAEPVETETDTEKE
ncbi:MAG: 30S ribosomal protein S6 [Ignavibacteria bacterium CG2_30_36_16]|nr:30S ribosomal protein S6 [Ignavibacteria bacterium]OIP59554.1 MAG: 30S ribosomal protein S6 [Ignavibacteria bacterium CG2_30_36_16]PJB00084.1 MAG: 30S ribosomal protein S6 [Ignavibacteria bacterium CG_4_9_14_3_um_filter_36_18]